MKSLMILTGGVLIGLGAFSAIVYFGNQNKNVENLSVSITPTYVQKTETPAIASPTPQVEAPGFIEGSVSYPSEGIPAGIEVCAETTDAVLVKCTNGLVKDSKYTYGSGYKIELPEGEYHVYAKTPGSDYKAYYTEFVTCGLKAYCPSHQKIIVGVKSGVTAEKIDPGDWYNN